MLWAAYDEQGQLSRPRDHIEDFGSDIAYQACQADNFRSNYSHLYNVTLWLPTRFGFVFEAEDVGGNLVNIGSSIELLSQLENLNRRTWNMASDMLEASAHQGADHGAPLEAGARFAFSLFLGLAQHSVDEKLPMLLDF